LKTLITYLLLSLTGIMLLGDAPHRDIVILVPSTPDSVSFDQSKLLIISASKESAPQLVVSAQWEKRKSFNLAEEGVREKFAADFYRLVPPQATIELLSYSFKYFKGYLDPDTLKFGYTDTLSIRGLWQKKEFAELAKTVQKQSDASEVVIYLRGWMDSTYAATYDDPNNDARTLYKLHVSLLPGANAIYFSSPGQREHAVSFVTTTALESKATVDRGYLFHNSALEQSCTTCHEGLPSADSGQTMNADCNVCHKELKHSTFLHAPVEMDECKSCHSWSKERHAVVVEKGVPTACYDCHSEKQQQVESSSSLHPVASECLTCHSQHGTQRDHLLKADVYDICTSCHEDQKMNHPVGRHPLRYAKLKNGEEISCVTCHNPHGSNFEKLKRFPGGRMDICTQCH